MSFLGCFFWRCESRVKVDVNSLTSQIVDEKLQKKLPVNGQSSYIYVQRVVFQGKAPSQGSQVCT